MSRIWDKPPVRVPRPGKSIAQSLRDDIYRRQQGLCACCGRPLGLKGWQAHHRKRRSQGGQDSICNLIGLKGSCHNSIHNHVARSQDFGYLVKRAEDPAAVPVHLFDGRIVLLRPDGNYETARKAA